jgi:hypothetical protein
MAYTFGDSFDLYAAVADVGAGYWDSAGAGATLQPGRFAGSQCIQWATAGITALVKNSTATTDPVHHLVFAVRQTAAISGTTLGLYFQLSDGATNQVCVVLRSDGAMLLTSATPAGTVLDTYTGAISAANTWTAFEVEIVIHNTTGSWAVRKNGNTSNDRFTGSLNTRPGANTQANKLTITTSGVLNAMQLDDLLWRSDAAAVPFVGDVRCYTRMPASDVQAQFSRSTGATNFSAVDEPQQNAATDYVFSSTVGQSDLYGIGAITATPVSVVAVTTRGFVQKSDAGTRNGAVQLKSGATTVQSTSTALSTTFGWLWRTDTVDPATSTAWTPVAVNNVTVGPVCTL